MAKESGGGRGSTPGYRVVPALLQTPDVRGSARPHGDYHFPEGFVGQCVRRLSLHDIARTGIGHVREDFYDCFHGVVLDDYNVELQSAYVADGAMVAAIVDPLTKALECLSEGDAQRSSDAPDCRMKETQKTSGGLTNGAATDAAPDDPASRNSAGINNTGSKEDRHEKPTSQTSLQHMRSMKQSGTHGGLH